MDTLDLLKEIWSNQLGPVKAGVYQEHAGFDGDCCSCYSAARGYHLVPAQKTFDGPADPQVDSEDNDASEENAALIFTAETGDVICHFQYDHERSFVANAQQLTSMLEPLVKAVAAIHTYLWEDELRHFQEAAPDEREGHIFHDLATLDQWLHGGPARTGEAYLRAGEIDANKPPLA